LERVIERKQIDIAILGQAIRLTGVLMLRGLI
jgi:hypothetical protein